MTTEEIYAIQPDAEGWRTLPGGARVRISDGVRLGDDVRIGNYVRLGAGVHLTTTPLQIVGPEYVVYPYAPGILGIGCVTLPEAEWRRDLQALAAANAVPPEHIPLYARYAEMVLEWMKIHMPVPGASQAAV